MSTENLRWVSWNQHGDDDHEPDCRPVAWPPPKEILAFWETGFGGGDGPDAFCTVVALVDVTDEAAAIAVIEKAWFPGIGEWRFNREYGKPTPPNDRFPPPKWALEMGRWPWRKA